MAWGNQVLGFGVVRPWVGGAEGIFDAISDLELIETGSGPRLMVLSRDAGSVYIGQASGSLPQVDLSYLATGSGLGAPPQLTVGTLGGDTVAFVSGFGGTGVTGLRLNASGQVSETFRIPMNGATVESTHLVTLGGGPVLYAAVRSLDGQVAVEAWRQSGNAWTQVDTLPGSFIKRSGNDVAAMDSLILSGTPHLLVPSAQNNTLTLFRLAANGTATEVDTLSAAEGFFVGGPSHIETLEMNGQHYALVGSVNSDSISVVALNAERMYLTDHVLDSRDTRFEGVAALEAIQMHGQTFVVVAGADAGLTLMTLLPNGRLTHLETIASHASLDLSALSAMTLGLNGASVDVFLASAGRTGTIHLEIPVGDLGGRVESTGGTARGTARDELIWGGDASEELRGEAGDDVIWDGGGSDRMRGGAGADLFVLARDGQSDRIDDFEAGLDRLDLSAWGRIYSAQALDADVGSNGITLTHGDEQLRIFGVGGASLTLADLGIIGLLQHSSVAPPPAARRVLEGSDVNDTIIGGVLDDDLSGGGGADLLYGGDGDDTLIGEDRDADFDTTAAQVYRLYQATLDRAPDPAGHLFWTNAILSDTASLRNAADGFVTSAEFQQRYGATSNEAFVNLLYNNVLGRDGDAGGVAFWSGQLNIGAMSRAEVVVGFSESDEYVEDTAVGSLAFGREGQVAAWSDDVFRLYQATLGRAPDEAGLRFWSDSLAQGLSYTEVIGGFVGSAEFQERYGATSNGAFVDLLYNNVLGRDGDAGGRTFWTGQLNSGAFTREGVVEGFAQSDEFVRNTATSMRDHMRSDISGDLLNGGPNDDTLFGGFGADTFEFRPQDGRDAIAGFEPWDLIDLSAFDYASTAVAMSHFRQSGTDVVFADAGMTITFVDTHLSDIDGTLLI